MLLGSLAQAASLYNLTGSEHGFGDVVGPYLLAQAGANEDVTYLLLDDRAEQVLKTFLERPAGLANSERLRFVRASDLPSLSGVTRIYETFAGARGGAKIDALSSLPPGERTVLVTQDLHSPYGRPYFPVEFRASGVGEVKGPRAHLFFSAAGLGRERLGILADPSVDVYANASSADRRSRAAEKFAGSPMEALLKKERHPSALLSFAYGVHNEVFSSPRWKPYPGQFKSYVKGMARIARREGKPVVLFSPNKPEILREAMGKRAGGVLLSAEEFYAQGKLKAGRVHVVSTGNLSNSQFVALTAAADLPYLIEGDSALSAAVRMGKPFVMMKGPWGLFGIDGLSAALTEAGATWASTMYPVHDEPGNDTPNFARLDQVQDDAAAFRRLRENAQDWNRSLERITALAEGKAKPAEVLGELKDPLLRYSWARDQWRRGAFNEKEFRAAIAGLPEEELEQLVRAKEAQDSPAACAASFERLAKP